MLGATVRPTQNNAVDQRHGLLPRPAPPHPNPNPNPQSQPRAPPLQNGLPARVPRRPRRLRWPRRRPPAPCTEPRAASERRCFHPTIRTIERLADRAPRFTFPSRPARCGAVWRTPRRKRAAVGTTRRRGRPCFGRMSCGDFVAIAEDCPYAADRPPFTLRPFWSAVFIFCPYTWRALRAPWPIVSALAGWRWEMGGGRWEVGDVKSTSTGFY